MTILARWARDLLERLLGRFREGPDTPRRLLEEPRLFRALSPEAPTEEEWEAFAKRLIDFAYRQGYVRGFHWAERSWDGPEKDPGELLAELSADPAWAEVLADPMSARKVREVQEAIARVREAGVPIYFVDDRRR